MAAEQNRPPQAAASAANSEVSPPTARAARDVFRVMGVKEVVMDMGFSEAVAYNLKLPALPWPRNPTTGQSVFSQYTL